MSRQADIGSGSYTVGQRGKLMETYRGYEIVREWESAMYCNGKLVQDGAYRFIIYGQSGIQEWAIRSLECARAWVDATRAGKSGIERHDAVNAAYDQKAINAMNEVQRKRIRARNQRRERERRI